MLKKVVALNQKTFDINFESTSVQLVRDIVNSFRNHKSLVKIKQVVNGFDVSYSERFSFNETEIKNLRRNLDIKKSSGIDAIPLKLIKLSDNFLTPLLTQVLHKMFFQKTLKLLQ